MAVTPVNTPPTYTSPSTSSSSTVTADQLQALQTKYTTDQVQVAAGKLDPSALTTDYDAYLAAAKAWQSGGQASAILPINEPSPSVSSPVNLKLNEVVTPSISGDSTPTISGGSTPSVSTPSISTASVGGVPSYIAGSATLDPSYRSGPYAAYADAIEAAAKSTGVSANLLGAMVADESRGQYTGMLDPLQAGGTGTMPENVLTGAKHLIDSANESAAKFGNGSVGLALRDYNSGLLGTDPSNLSALPAGTGRSYYVDQVTSNLKLINAGQSTDLPK